MRKNLYRRILRERMDRDKMCCIVSVLSLHLYLNFVVMEGF